MAETYNLVVQGFGKRLVFACCNHDNQDLCTVPHEYVTGRKPPNYPVPAVPLQVKYDYVGCINIDDVTDPDDPIIVWFYDSWAQSDVTFRSLLLPIELL